MVLAPPIIKAGQRSDEQLENWIDQVVTDGADVLEIASGIAAITRPGGTAELEVSPELVGNEGWFWPWNRAGFLCLKRQRPADAALLFTAAYLAALRFQGSGRYRIHKGMPLCNIAYAWLRGNELDRATLPALLGLVEESVTHGNPIDTASYKNLITANFPEMPARSLGGLFLMLTRERGIVPLYPEAVLDCARRGNAFVSSELVAEMDMVGEGFSPETIPDSLGRLEEIWERFRSYIESVINRRQIANGEPAAVSPSGTKPAASGGRITSHGGSDGGGG